LCQSVASKGRHFVIPVLSLSEIPGVKIKLTDIHLANLRAGRADVTLSDTQELGLRARARASGTVTFILHARNNAGKLKLVTLGRYPSLSLKEARKLAARERVALKDGVDVNQKKRALRASVAASAHSATLREILGEYQGAYSHKLKSWRPAGPRTPRSIAGRCIEAVFVGQLDKPLISITLEELARAC